jgi:hypothetical protein
MELLYPLDLNIENIHTTRIAETESALNLNSSKCATANWKLDTNHNHKGKSDEKFFWERRL